MSTKINIKIYLQNVSTQGSALAFLGVGVIIAIRVIPFWRIDVDAIHSYCVILFQEVQDGVHIQRFYRDSSPEK